MTKIEELIDKYRRQHDHYADAEFDEDDIEHMMKEYAVWYANISLAKAADEAQAEIRNWDEAHVIKSSITRIQLPQHE